MMRRIGPAGLLAFLLTLGACGRPGGQAAAPRLVRARAGTFDPRAGAGPAIAGVETVAVGPARPWIVQLDGPVHPAMRRALVHAGARIVGYYPVDALLVRAGPKVAASLSKVPGVRAVVAQTPALRIDPALLVHRGGRLLASSRTRPETMLVATAGASRVDAVAGAVRALGGKILRTDAGGGLLRVRLAPAAAPALAARTDVTWVERAPRLHYLNEEARWVIQAGSGPANVGKTPIWDHGITGKGQIVAIADSGINQKSCFFADVPGKILAYKVLPGAKAGDEIGHGTHTSGSLAGNETTVPRLEGFDGQAKDAQLYFQDVGADASGNLSAVPDDLGALFTPAYDAGARIHSDSWGGNESTYDAFARTIDEFVAAHPDFLVVFANGNAGPKLGSVGTPATAKDLISVGASENATIPDPSAPNAMAFFSSEGPTADGRIKPTLTAPGDKITSADWQSKCGVVAEQGTSMATPTLAGGADLAREYFTDGFYPSGKKQSADGFDPSAALLRAVLIAGAAHMTGAYAGRVPSLSQGFGRIDLGRSLYFAGDPAGTRLWVDDVSAGIGTGDAPATTLKTDRAGPLRVALAWTDPPGTLGAASALVNDLDLEVTAPDGTVYRGNVIAHGESVPGGSADPYDVEELVTLDDAPKGSWTVTVKGTDVPQGPQTFALAVIGEVVVTGQAAPSADPGPPAPPDRNPAPQACTDAVVSPGRTAVGWLSHGDPKPIHLSDDDLYAGSLALVKGGAAQKRDAVFQVPVDVPAGDTLEKISVTVIGQDDASLLPGSVFTFDAVDLPAISSSTQFAAVDAAPVLATGEQVLDDSQVGRLVSNVITFPASAVNNGKLTIRISGAGPPGSTMSWDSGVAQFAKTGASSNDVTPGLGRAPVVGLCLGQGPAGHVTPLTLAPVPEKAVHVGTKVTFTATLASDPKVATPTLVAGDLPDGASFDATTGAFTWTPKAADLGDHFVVISAFEGGMSSKIAAEVFVLAKPPPPAKKAAGCGCSAGAGSPASLLAVFLGLVALGLRRRPA